MVSSVKVATPLTACAVVLPTSLAPAVPPSSATDTLDTSSEVLPKASCTLMATGAITPPTSTSVGPVVRAMRAAAAARTLKAALVADCVPSWAASVMFDAALATDRLVNRATP